MTSEFQRIALLRAILDPAGAMIGDDCAVLDSKSGGPGSLVWSIDASVEHVHFERAWMSLEDIGWRATMAAFSDLAAMGAEPLGALSALTLPGAFSDDELSAIAWGQREATEALGTAIVGGNLARGAVLSVTTTVLGRAARPLTRRDATAGAGVFVAGSLGLAAAGLFDAARAEGRPDRQGERWTQARFAFRRPRARLTDGQVAADRGAIAAIDVSDGLAADAAQLAKESKVAIALSEEALAPLIASLPHDVGFDQRAAVLHGGEDYALLAIARDLPPPFVRIGDVLQDRDARVYLRDATGTLSALDPTGFDHFR